ncbi:MAG: C25 family cysteine peptidase, partial [Candidatus Omnitrophica bacterium]|nr:C25 family cysteine peptidase [Candidatus Omnitrophota bacterium]
MKSLKIKNSILVSIIFFVSTGIFLSSGVAHAKNNAKSTTSLTKNNVIEVTVEFPQPVITEAGGYQHIEMEGLYSVGNPGEPVLPVKGINVLIPAGKEIKGSEVILGEKITLPGKYNIEPAQKPVPLSYEGEVEKTLPKEEIYNSNNPYPKEKKEKITTQKTRGYEVAIFKLCPIEYIPQEGKLSYYKSIAIKLNLEPKSKVKAKEIIEGKTALKIKEPRLRKLPKDKERLEQFISNPQDISGYDTLAKEPGQGTVQLLAAGGESALTFVNPAESYQYVVITNEELKNAPGPYNFQALCAEKNARGITTNIVTTEWIYANYDGTRPDGGTDNATKIRNFIIDAYNNWETKYILLGGDATGNPSNTEIIPARFLYSNSSNGSIASDLYYCCLDGTMDYDADGVYGEPTDGVDGGEIDLLAEVYIGRVPIVTTQELANIVKKSLSYQSSGAGYLRNTYMVGQQLGGDYYATGEMEEIRLGSNTNGYTTAGFATLPYLQLNTLYDAPGYYWPQTDLINIINNGVHVLNHLGHSWIYFNMGLSNPDVDALTNTEYFFGYSQGCFPGAFDEDCILEHFIKNPTGAFAFVGNSRYGWLGPSQYFNRQFWDAVFGEGILSLGIINQDSKEDNLWTIDYSSHKWCYLELNLFGDPEISLKFTGWDGTVGFGKDIYSTSTSVNITVVDTDLNIDPLAKDTVTVYVKSNTESAAEPVILTEQANDSSCFTGSIPLRLGAPQADGMVQVSENDVITVTYNEESPYGIKTDTAIVEGIPPIIINDPSVSAPSVREDTGIAEVTISWQTNEPSTSTVYYGGSIPLDMSASAGGGLVTNHEVTITINELDPDTQYYFAVESTDSAGNTCYDDNSGAYYRFTIIPPDIEITPLGFTLEKSERSEPFSATLTISNQGEAGSVGLFFNMSSSVTWISSITPSCGIVDNGSSAGINITIDPSALTSGTYNGVITVDNNTPSENCIDIPIQLNLLMDDRSPQVTITSPVEGGECAPNAILTAIATDDYTTTSIAISIFVDEVKMWTTNATTGVAFNYNFTGLSLGPKTIKVVAADERGQTDFKSVNITIVPDAELQTGWPKATGGIVRSSPAIADIDGDGGMEVVVGSNDKKVYAW